VALAERLWPWVFARFPSSGMTATADLALALLASALAAA